MLVANWIRLNRTIRCVHEMGGHMTNIAEILSSGVQALDLGDEYETLQAIETIYRRWGDLKDELMVDTSAATFLAKLDDELDNPKVAAALEKLTLDDELESIKKMRGRITKFFNKAGIDHPTRLLARLSDNTEDTADANTGMVRWSLIKKDPSTIADGGFGKGDFNLDLGGKAQIEVEGGALWPYKKDEVAQRLVRMGVAGNLNAKGKFKTPFSLGPLAGSAGGKVDADAGIELDYYFDPADQTTLLAGAVAKRIKRLPNPLDYGSIMSAYNSGADFFGFDLSKGGGVSAEVEVSIGKGLDLKDIGKLAAEIKVKATLVRRRQFQISLRRLEPAHQGDPKTRLTVSGKKLSKDGKSIGVQVVLEFGELAKHVHEKLTPYVGKWDTTLQKIKPYLTPGTYLKNEAKDLVDEVVGKLISNDDIAAAVTADMGLLLGTSKADDLELGEYFTSRIEDALNGLVSSLVGDVEEQASDLLAGLKEQLPIFATLDQDDVLLTELKKLTGKVNTAFEEELTKRTVNTETKRKKIADTLAKIGRSANGVVKDADKAAAKVRELVDEVDRIVKKAMELLSDSAKHEAKLSFTYSAMKTDKASFELVADLSPTLAQEDYRTLLSGNFNDTRELLMREEDPGTPTTIEFQDGTKVKQVSENQSKFEGSFMVFGVGAEWSNVFDGKAEFEADHRGNVEITTRGSGTKKSRTLFGKEDTEASFIDVVSIARAKEGVKTGSKPSIDLALSLKRTDTEKGMDAGEFETLMKHARRYSLITQEGRDELSDTFNDWRKSGGNRGVPVTVEIRLPLTSEQIMKIVERGNPMAFNHHELHPLRTLEIAVDAIYATSSANRHGTATELHQDVIEQRAWAFKQADKIRKVDGTDGQMIWSLGERKISQAQLDNAKFHTPLEAGQALDDLYEWSNRAWALYEMCQELYKISTELPDVAAGKEPWDGRTYASRQKDIAKKTRGWLATGQWLMVLGTDGIDRKMAAFFLTLGGLAGLSYEEVASSVTFTLTHTKQSGKQVVVS